LIVRRPLLQQVINKVGNSAAAVRKELAPVPDDQS
jgi:hypothetical protein